MCERCPSSSRDASSSGFAFRYVRRRHGRTVASGISPRSSRVPPRNRAHRTSATPPAARDVRTDRRFSPQGDCDRRSRRRAFLARSGRLRSDRTMAGRVVRIAAGCRHVASANRRSAKRCRRFRGGTTHRWCTVGYARLVRALRPAVLHQRACVRVAIRPARSLGELEHRFVGRGMLSVVSKRTSPTGSRSGSGTCDRTTPLARRSPIRSRTRSRR